MTWSHNRLTKRKALALRDDDKDSWESNINPYLTKHFLCGDMQQRRHPIPHIRMNGENSIKADILRRNLMNQVESVWRSAIKLYFGAFEKKPILMTPKLYKTNWTLQNSYRK